MVSRDLVDAYCVRYLVIVTQTARQVVARGNRLELLVEATEDLQEAAHQFQKQVRSVYGDELDRWLEGQARGLSREWAVDAQQKQARGPWRCRLVALQAHKGGRRRRLAS